MSSVAIDIRVESNSPRPAAATHARLELVRETGGARYNELDINAPTDIRLTDDPAAAYQAAAEELSMPVADVEASPFHAFGSVETLVRRLRDARDRYGINYLRFDEEDVEAYAPLVRALRD